MVFGEAVVLFASGLVTHVLISRWSGPELLGQYSVVLAWIVLLQGVGSFGLPEFAARELGRVRDEQGKYLAHGLMIGLAASALTMALVASLVTVLDHDAGSRRALLLGVLTLAPAMADGIARGGFLASRHTGWILLVRCVEVIVVVPVNAGLIMTGHGVAPLVLTLAAGKLVASLLSLCLLNRYAFPLRWTLDLGLCRRMVGPALTFWGSHVLGLVSTRVTIIMLSWWAPIAAVGLYAAASKIIDVMLMIPVMLAHFMLPRMADSFSRPSDEAAREHDGIFRVISSVTIPLSVGILFFAGPVVHTLFGPRFGGAIPIARLLAVYFILESADILTSVVLKAAGQQAADMKMYSVNPASNILLGALLIPAFGGIGAALTKIASVAASFGLRYAYASRRVAVPGWPRLAGTPLAVSVGVATALVGVQGRIPDVLLGLLYGAAVAVTLYPAIRRSVAREVPETVRRPNPSSPREVGTVTGLEGEPAGAPITPLLASRERAAGPG